MSSITRKENHEIKDIAAELVSQLLMVTSGVGVVPDNDAEWGNRNLLHLFELFIQSESPRTLAEDLQYVVFDFTRKRDNAFSEWKKEAFSERGLDEDAEPLEETKVLDLSNHPENLNISAQQVCELINRKGLPKDVKKVLQTWCAEHAEVQNA